VLRIIGFRRGLQALDPARRLRHQAVAALVAGAFLADLVLGGVSPIFPLFAKRLGASSADLVALVTAAGLSSLVLVVPSARLADRLGKRYVFTVGIVLYGVAALVLAAAHEIAVLALPQALLGVAGVCTFTVGFACLADTVTGPALSRAVGFYTAAMGAGYGVGPLLTGWSVGALGYRGTFLWCGGLGVVAAGTVLWGLQHARAGAAQPGRVLLRSSPPPPGRARRGLWPGGTVLLASFANLPTTLSINIGILTFFPVYAATLHWSTSLVGVVLFGRAMASSAGRLAMRTVHRLPVPPLTLIRATLFVETAVIGLVAVSRNVAFTLTLLALEGINYGITMTLAQLTIVAGTDAGNSASSLVWYNAASSVAQLAGGGVVAVLVAGHSARDAIVVVMLVCLVLACTYAVLLAWRRQRGRAAAAAASVAPS
jgi:MFS family permease